MGAPARAPDRPLGGSSGRWRERFVRFHAPLAVVSAVFLVLFMTLPTFDPLAYVRANMEDRGALPQPAPTGVHGGGQTPAPSDHGTRATPASGHGASQATAPTGHTGSTAPAAHGTSQAEPDDSRSRSRFDQRLTVATGYLATALLGFTLLVGPANLLLRRRNPVSSYLRRDAGMWTAAFSVVHVIVGLQVHGGGQLSGMLGYFFERDGGLLLNSFGLANWVGLVATVIVVGLLTISSDLALRTLKAGRWKLLQRLNYALFALVVVHALLYGALLRATSPFTLLLLLTVIAVLAGQALGVWLWRRRQYARRTLSAA